MTRAPGRVRTNAAIPTICRVQCSHALLLHVGALVALSRMLPRLYLLALSASLFASALGLNAMSQTTIGPWGELEQQTIYLEVPDWIIAQTGLPGTRPRWHLPVKDGAAAQRFLISAGVPLAVVDRWLKAPQAEMTPGAYVVFPTPAEIEALPGSARAAIYPELAKLPANEFYHEPIYVGAPSVEEWLLDTSLPPEIIRLVRDLAYIDHGVLVFSDLETVLSRAGSDAERAAWLKQLVRTKAVLAHLRIDPDDDIAAIADYWGGGPNRKDVLPLLESVRETPGGGHLDVAHLIPALARHVIYTYPAPHLFLLGQAPNCHWTSLNFFNFHPQNIYLDLRLASTGVLANYDKVERAERLGDILFFVNSQGGAEHSCTYIASDLVFTKNGDSAVSPWILTTLDQVKAIYLRKPGSSISVWRLKNTRPGVGGRP